jgi:AAHS family 4-hydroxybenzoate transporter-like MFS transporter
VGWALGMGRVGSIVGPLVGGVLLAGKWSTEAVFLTAAGAALCAALAAFGLSRITGRKAVEQPTSFGAKLGTEAKAGT